MRRLPHYRLPLLALLGLGLLALPVVAAQGGAVGTAASPTASSAPAKGPAAAKGAPRGVKALPNPKGPKSPAPKGLPALPPAPKGALPTPQVSARPSGVPTLPPPGARPREHGPLKVDPGKIHIISDYMKYDRKGKMALASGNVTVAQDDLTIDTAEVQFDQGRKISYMNTPVHLVQQKKGDARTVLDANRMTTFHKEKRVLAEGAVKMVKAKNPQARPENNTQKAKLQASVKKEDTVITAKSLEYWTGKKDAKFTGDVVILNGSKKTWGDNAFMDHAANTMTLDGHVKVVQINGSWLIRDKIVEADQPDEARDEALRSRASLTSDHLVVDQATNDAVATGEVVRIEQKGKVATGKRAVFSDADHTITLTENVRIQQTNGDWLTAAKAIFHTNTEVFEAYSGGPTQVQTEFDVPEPGKPAPSAAPKKDSGRVNMEFDVNTPGK